MRVSEIIIMYALTFPVIFFTEFEEALSLLVLCAPSIKPSAAIFVSYENGGLRVFSCFVRFLVK